MSQHVLLQTASFFEQKEVEDDVTAMMWCVMMFITKQHASLGTSDASEHLKQLAALLQGQHDGWLQVRATVMLSNLFKFKLIQTSKCSRWTVSSGVYTGVFGLPCFLVFSGV